jgi:hypothetical protein
MAMAVATLWMVSVGTDLECGANLMTLTSQTSMTCLTSSQNAASTSCAWGVSGFWSEPSHTKHLTCHNNCYPNRGLHPFHPHKLCSLTCLRCQHEKSTPKRGMVRAHVTSAGVQVDVGGDGRPVCDAPGAGDAVADAIEAYMAAYPTGAG